LLWRRLLGLAMSKPRLLPLASLVLLVVGVAQAAGRWWTCDDAYIHFRYSDNFARGLGLVYNAGERVEGYLTFLWNVVLGIGIWLGGDPLVVANLLGLLAFGGTLALLLRVSLALPVGGLVLPVAALGFALHRHAQTFATSGMETSMHTLLVTWLVLRLANAQRTRDYFVAGLIGVIDTLTRLDGALFCAGGFVVVVWSALRQRRFGPVLAYCLPTLLLYVPYFCWRWHYYGHLLPNLYYAKSAGRAYPSQGWVYLRLFFECYWALLPGLVALPLLFLARFDRAIQVPGWTGLRGPATVCCVVMPQLAYVVWVGGDFMFARFLIPVTPAILIGLQMLLPALRSRTVAVLVSAAVLVGIAWPNYPTELESKHGHRGIVEEPYFYKRGDYDHARYMGVIGRALAHHTRDTETRVMIGAGQAALGYFGRFAVVIEKNGLTDEYIAHLPLTQRGRVAHERASIVPHEYFSHRRKVHFYFDTDYGAFQDQPGPIGNARQVAFELTGLTAKEQKKVEGTPAAWIKGYLVTYQSELMDVLRTRPGIRFTPFPELLDAYLDRVAKGEVPREQVARDYPHFAAFYFDHNHDAARQARFQALLR
ncbi:MAG: hypothetical protein KDC87_15460, partial [Planctomycetes bacterium]|nr:hypothetical protein [Planctomycetota bacterium]